ncbi:MAG: glycosyltransferase family 4 protein [Roseivirga sp.]|uniref:glycosyltransferase family 4 protein n=1 Tax=Roseivirga sp. TaxID=1964215 RepID=UPI001B28AB31|nr:glycosyltransferase family 4 protein [Roseivirga sp.]MBO6497709.1 glycosyltransferase family 4 protein [Roseivirga sp.]
MRLYVFRTCYELLGLWIADGVIVNSPEILEGISQVYRLKKKALVIDTSIDVKFWKPLEIEREKKTIFFAGRLAKRKGIDTLLESFRMLYSDDKEFKLILAGEASAEEPFDWGLAFLEKHSLKGAVTLTGHLNREKMREYFSSSAVFVLPSRQEGSPRVVKEALSCECPVITSSLPGCLSLDPDRRVINFLNDNDPIILKRLILKQLDENKTNDISYRKFVSKRFSKFQIAQATSQFYKSLVN